LALFLSAELSNPLVFKTRKIIQWLDDIIVLVLIVGIIVAFAFTLLVIKVRSDPVGISCYLICWWSRIVDITSNVFIFGHQRKHLFQAVYTECVLLSFAF
jgi:hypothetical protein